MECEEHVVAQPLDRIRDIVGKSFDRHSSWSRRVLEDEVVLEGKFAHERTGLLEVFVRLGGEADNDVARDADIGHDADRALHEIDILASRIAAVHEFQDSIGTALGRHMQILTDTRTVAHHREHIVAEVARVTGHEAKAEDLRYFIVDALQEPCEGGDARTRWWCAAKCRQPRTNLRRLPTVHGDCKPMFIAVMVHGLSKQRDLERACIGESAALIHDVIGRTMNLGAASGRHHAVGAELVAAASDPNLRTAASAAHGLFVERPGEIECLEIVLRSSERA